MSRARERRFKAIACVREEKKRERERERGRIYNIFDVWTISRRITRRENQFGVYWGVTGEPAPS